MSQDSRTSMVRSAASLISSRGVSATSFSDVLADSGAPRGSIYHHFPLGKTQLAEEAIRWTAERVLTHQRKCAATTAEGVMKYFIDIWRYTVRSSNAASGCVAAGVALDTVASESGLLQVVREAFRSWVALLASQFEAAGVPAPRATPLALMALASMEGALILCRAEGSSQPLDTVAEELMRLVPRGG